MLDCDTLGSESMGHGILKLDRPLIRDLKFGYTERTVPLKLRNKSAGHVTLALHGDFSDSSRPIPIGC